MDSKEQVGGSDEELNPFSRLDSFRGGIDIDASLFSCLEQTHA